MRLLNKKEGITLREIITKGLRSLYIDIPALRPGTAGAYALALVAVGVTTALHLAINPYVEGFQFATFLPAVIITALIGGLGAGLFSVALTDAATTFFVLPPRLSLYVERPGDVVMLFTVALIAGMRFAVERRWDRQALQASNDRLQLALDAAQLGWWQYDPICGLVWWDKRLKEMLNVAEDPTDIEEFRRHVHPDDIERVWAAVEAALDPADPKPYATEYRVHQKGGEICWVEAHGLVHFEGAGAERRAISMVGTAQDITQRKRRDEERKRQMEKEHLLMREVNHRAKNMLSIVHAIAHQTVTKNPDDFIEHFSDRVQALSANQELLVRNEWKGVEIKGLVHSQLAHLADLIGSRIWVDGPRLLVKANSAQAIGLALHELATNSGKYGALSTDAGRVDIRWGTDDETFTMSWTEREGPLVSAPQRRGFGTVVMQEMAERSVDGKVDLGYAPSGVTWRLTCPAVNALQLTA
jgi:PAS domain S-box-containing protein